MVTHLLRRLRSTRERHTCDRARTSEDDDKRTCLLFTEGVPQAAELDLAMQRIAVEMELAGLPIDLNVLADVDKKQTAECNNALEVMREITGVDDFVPRGESLLWALFDPLGPLQLRPLARSAKTGKPSTAKEYLLKMTHEPFVQHLLRWRKYDYSLSHYVRSDALKPHSDGRLHLDVEGYRCENRALVFFTELAKLAENHAQSDCRAERPKDRRRRL